MKNGLMRVVDRISEWITRERPIERKLLGAGFLCLATAGAGSGWTVETTILGRQVKFSPFPQMPEILSWILVIVGSTAIFAAILIGIWRYSHDRADHDNKGVLVIEQRGLRDTTDTPLAEAVPRSIKGRRQPLIIDIRDRIKDGVVTDPETALERVSALPRMIEPYRNGRGSSDMVVAYGGLSPVPFTFLAGVLLDDESQIVTLDWDRTSEAWRQLNADDDGDSFEVTGIEQIPPGTTEVAVAVSVSYLVDPGAVSKSLPSSPIVELKLPRRFPDNHWSETKQQRLAKQFLATMIRIADSGVATIHLFLAAQNSVVFRLGRVYDKRNLPRILVYQYQKGRAVEHPWSIEMPVQDVGKPAVVQALPGVN